MSKDPSISQAAMGAPSGAKRIVPRYPFEARFKIRIERPGEVLETEGWARDLSESGLGAFVATPISIGEAASLRIPMPSGGDLIIPAIVTRQTGTQYGFRFMALSGQQRSQILRAIAGKKAIPVHPALV